VAAKSFGMKLNVGVHRGPALGVERQFWQHPDFRLRLFIRWNGRVNVRADQRPQIIEVQQLGA
jgi:hypothetical protein